MTAALCTSDSAISSAGAAELDLWPPNEQMPLEEERKPDCLRTVKQVSAASHMLLLLSLLSVSFPV